MEYKNRGEDGQLEKPIKAGTEPTQSEQLVALQTLNKSLMLTVTDMFEENLVLHELNRNVMLVITDLYEAVYPAEEGGS